MAAALAINRYPDVSGRGTGSGPRVQESRPRDAARQSGSSEPWSEVPPELEPCFGRRCQKPTSRPPARPRPTLVRSLSRLMRSSPRCRGSGPEACVPRVDVEVGDDESRRRRRRRPPTFPTTPLRSGGPLASRPRPRSTPRARRTGASAGAEASIDPEDRIDGRRGAEGADAATAASGDGRGRRDRYRRRPQAPDHPPDDDQDHDHVLTRAWHERARTRGHPAARAAIGAMARSGGPGAVLLVGPAGVGKTTLATDLAAAPAVYRGGMRPRARGAACRACRLVLGGVHPDVHRLGPEGPGRQVVIGGPGSKVRGIRDLIGELALLPWRVAHGSRSSSPRTG